ncbi:hypothetical protein KSP39_PZI022182 [Platanthera zijinensis]|uniref:Uncharacterized protein n=1 Tax=Platanthera zijinensis TaxID=2320716 RepID=A0AAP0FUS6_9ASPA
MAVAKSISAVGESSFRFSDHQTAADRSSFSIVSSGGQVSAAATSYRTHRRPVIEILILDRWIGGEYTNTEKKRKPRDGYGMHEQQGRRFEFVRVARSIRMGI